ncbi:MAG: LemA family protein [Nevskiaceae bacterium]|nr:LemA family protein [Nevskiaceae bacterium]
MLIWWLAAVALVVLIAAVALFNRLVAARNQVRAAWSDIDVQLIRRHDLVPQLVAAVQGYAAHERATLTLVTELRARAMRVQSLQDKAQVESELSGQVQRILALQESYPDLKSSDNFLALQRDLVAVEDHLQYARRFYNGSVRDLNNRIQTFPSLLVARIANIQPAEFFRQGDEQEPPR